MKNVGIDLHKKTVRICTVDPQHHIVDRRRFLCSQPDRVRAYFAELGESRPSSKPQPVTNGRGCCWSPWPAAWLHRLTQEIRDQHHPTDKSETANA